MCQRALISVALTAVVSLAATSGCGRLAPAGPEADFYDEDWPSRPDTVAAVREKFPVAATTIIDNGGPEVQEATGTTTVRGRFHLAGTTTPSARNLTAQVKKVKGDLAVCLPDGKDVYSKAIEINADNRGIKNVLVYMWTKNDSIGWENVSRPAEATALADDLDGNLAENQVDFDQKACLFLARVTPIQVGKTLKIINSDKVTHNTNIVGVRNVNVPGGTSITVPLPQEEKKPISVTCSIHTWMEAWLLPRTNGYFAVTDKDGRFEIPNVPTGVKLDFMVWHEVPQQLALNVERPGIPSLKWNLKKRGRFQFKHEQDTPVDFGDIEVPLSALNP